MTYEPFAPGPAPVALRHIELEDSSRGKGGHAVDIWYPATESGRDAEAAAGRFPLVMHNRGAFGHLPVNTLLCTHLASHGYIVASNDRRDDTRAHLSSVASLVIERLVDGADPLLADHIDGTRVGACGEAVGGWTTLGLNAVNRRMAASFAIDPLQAVSSAIQRSSEAIGDLRLDAWGRPIPTFVLADDGASLTDRQALSDLYAKLRAPKRFAILRGARERRFDAGSLVSHAAVTQRALCLAHMDAHLKADDNAFVFLDRDLAETFAAHGIYLEVARPVHTGYVAGVL